METTVHNFIDIFNSSFLVEENNTKLNKIVIPIIQRDYAQGRTDSDINRIRTRFLKSLSKAISGMPITLDFVYGDIDSDGVMTPLDGQQRLTTLFLLHWYIAKREHIEYDEYKFLHNFSYETRYSSRDFCNQLVDFNPSFNEKISGEIKNQSWFPMDWEKDPTISSMLVMIDAIDSEFSQTNNVWEKLKSGHINFYFLPIKDMGLTDELYIKMNSRGKPLTQFEHFKAEFESELKKIDNTIAKRIIGKIDGIWTDMLWYYRGDDNIIDDEFLNYFKFICSIVCYESGSTMQGQSLNEFDLLSDFFSINVNNVNKNLELFESYFDCLCNIQGYNNPHDFFTDYFSYTHELNKIKIDSRYDIDILKECLQKQLSLPRTILLYAVIIYLLNSDKITYKEFIKRLRTINNLVQNSNDEISDSERRAGGNRMPAILRQTKNIMLKGTIDNTIDSNFNANQLLEEADKIIWVNNNSSKAEDLYKLEDHDLLYGQIGIIGLENDMLFSRFNSLFDCDWDYVDCALMVIGFYGQKENQWRYQLGTASRNNETAWKELFHKSKKEGFERTKAILVELLSKYNDFSNECLQLFINNFITECENKSIFPFAYYYIKYSCFRPQRFGKCCWYNFNKQYELLVLVTRSNFSENTYQPFLKEVCSDSLSREDYGQSLIVDNFLIQCTNDSFLVKNIHNNAVYNTIKINQNEDGFDTENRIEKLKEYLNLKN